MRLFIASTGTQDLDFHYRIIENNRSLKMLVPSGQNKMLGDANMNAEQIEGVVRQGALYGMVKYEDVNDLKKKQRIVAIFRTDEPVPAGMIADVMAWNRKELTEIGKEQRAELAIVASHVLQKTNDRAGETTDISIEEVEPSTMSREAGETLGEGYAAPGSNKAKEISQPGVPRNRRR